jgi:hypothetical protein
MTKDHLAITQEIKGILYTVCSIFIIYNKNTKNKNMTYN